MPRSLIAFGCHMRGRYVATMISHIGDYYYFLMGPAIYLHLVVLPAKCKEADLRRGSRVHFMRRIYKLCPLHYFDILSQP